MKKLICFMITLTLLLSSVSVAFAGQTGSQEHKGKGLKVTKQVTKQITKQATRQVAEQVAKYDTTKATDKVTKQAFKENKGKAYGNKQSFKIDGSPVIKYGKYKILIRPITKGMGATVEFNKAAGVLTVTKDTTTIVIDLKNKKATVNGVEDTTSGIFTTGNDKKTTVLLKYIADRLGVRITFGKDKITTQEPKEDQEDENQTSKITVTPVGTAIVANTINTTTLYLTADATIPAVKATGGRAELYVGTVLVAVDTVIATSDTTVTFTTSDGTPTSAELQTLIPAGGAVTVKLYDAAGSLLKTYTSGTPITVDYVAPTVTGVTSAVLSLSGKSLYLTVSGAGAVNDKADITKLSLSDTTLNKTYQLTNAAVTGSNGVVTNEATIIVNLGTADLLGLTGFGGSTVFLNIAAGSLLIDAAGNTSVEFPVIQTVPVTVVQ